MSYGLLSGLLWGLDTVLLGIVMAMSHFVQSEQIIFLAPFISTFFHDTFSTLWLLLYLIFKGQFKQTIEKIKSRSGRFIMLGALLGGPVGMTGYLLAIKYLGPAYTAIISSLYPALGALLSYLFLKEKMKKSNMVGLMISILGIIILGYSPQGMPTHLMMGFIFALLCVFGWASEAVICSYGMKDDELTPNQSLFIRQLTSAITYGVIIIPLIQGVTFTVATLSDQSLILIILTALAGTLSYSFYYKAIHKIGATKAMSLNITYSAWAVLFGIVLQGNSIDLKSVICGGLIMMGSILAAGDLSEFKLVKTK